MQLATHIRCMALWRCTGGPVRCPCGTEGWSEKRRVAATVTAFLARLSAAWIIVLVALTAPVPALAAASIVIDVATGRVLSHENAFQRWYPASLTKLMTAYVAFRAVRAGEVTLKSPVVVSARAAKEPPSKMGYKPGSVLTLDDALKILMVKSANDIATAVGESLAGSEEYGRAACRE